MAESIIAYIPSMNSSDVSIYQYKKEEYSFTWNHTGNISQRAIYNFELPSTALTYRLKIPACVVHGENTGSPEIVVWNNCRCGLYDMTEAGSMQSRGRFGSNQICYLSAYTYQPNASVDAGLYVRVGFSQEQNTNTGSAFFHCWTDSPVVITCEYIYLDPKFPD